MPIDLDILTRDNLERNIAPKDNDDNFVSLKSWGSYVYPCKWVGQVECLDYWVIPGSGPRSGTVSCPGLEAGDIVMIRQIIVGDPSSTGEWETIGAVKYGTDEFTIYTNSSSVSTWNYMVFTPTSIVS